MKSHVLHGCGAGLDVDDVDEACVATPSPTQKSALCGAIGVIFGADGGGRDSDGGGGGAGDGGDGGDCSAGGAAGGVGGGGGCGGAGGGGGDGGWDFGGVRAWRRSGVAVAVEVSAVAVSVSLSVL